MSLKYRALHHEKVIIMQINEFRYPAFLNNLQYRLGKRSNKHLRKYCIANTTTVLTAIETCLENPSSPAVNDYLKNH